MAIADEALCFLLCFLLTEPLGRMTERISQGYSNWREKIPKATEAAKYCGNIYL